MGHNRPLFELIMEESRSAGTTPASKWRQEFGGGELEAPPRCKIPKTKLGWFSRPKKAHDSPPFKPITPSPTLSSTDYESAHDTFHFIDDCHGHLGLPCLQDDGHRYLDMAMALDMMELRVAQACAERDVALSQALDLRFAIDSIRNRLHEVEQYCMHLNYQLFLGNTST